MPLTPNVWAAVPDPDNADRMTYWSIGSDGVIRDFPYGYRWRPYPPHFPGVDQAQRSVLRQQWYDRTYYPWRRAVAAAIEADPVAAERRFLDKYPDPEAVPRVATSKTSKAPRIRRQPVRSGREALSRDATTEAQALVAYALHADGHSHAAIATALGISEPTARRRVLVGRGLVMVRQHQGDYRPPVDQFTAALSRLLDIRTALGEPLDQALGDAISGIIARRASTEPG